MSKVTIEFSPAEIEMEEGENFTSGLNYMVREAVKEEAKRLFDDTLKASLKTTIDNLCTTKAALLVDEALAGKWQSVNSYGTPTGEPVPLKDYLLQRIEVALKAKENTYSDAKPLLEAIISRTVREFLDGEIANEVHKAKSEIKTSMEKGIASMIRAAAQDIIAGKFGT